MVTMKGHDGQSLHKMALNPLPADESVIFLLLVLSPPISFLWSLSKSLTFLLYQEEVVFWQGWDMNLYDGIKIESRTPNKAWVPKWHGQWDSRSTLLPFLKFWGLRSLSILPSFSSSFSSSLPLSVLIYFFLFEHLLYLFCNVISNTLTPNKK